MKKEGNVHAENRALYADDAKTHDEPWKLWQVKGDNGVWRDCLCNPMWAYDTEYRRKPKTHFVHGVEIPDLRIKVFNEETQDGDCIGYCVDPLDVELYTEHYLMIPRFLELGILYEHTEEGKQAAILHAKAWLGITIQINERKYKMSTPLMHYNANTEIKDTDMFTVMTATSHAFSTSPSRGVTDMSAKEIKERYYLLEDKFLVRAINTNYEYVEVICISRKEDDNTLVYYSVPNRENTRREHLSEQLREYFIKDDPNYIYVP